MTSYQSPVYHLFVNISYCIYHTALEVFRGVPRDRETIMSTRMLKNPFLPQAFHGVLDFLLVHGRVSEAEENI
jgi:hypothetical protein